jgi:ferritin-like metal-binding protein YciE
MIKKTVKDTVKSMTGGTDNTMLEEIELMRTKQDLIIENAEVVAYVMLIQICQRSSLDDAVPTLKQNLSEEELIANWIKTNIPTMLNQLWPR